MRTCRSFGKGDRILKLISCYIEGYGSARKKQFDFSDNITVLYEKNGFGKTTLASFIKAMFYGLDSYKANTKDFVDRRHFRPFDGGNFGGNIVFEKGGDTYKIERFFDEKSDTKDFAKVYKNGNEFPCPQEKIGETLLGIDKAAFERTVFLTADETEIKPNDSIKTKLGNFVSGAEENGLSAALKRLDDEAKKYKKRGNDGLIPQQLKKIAELSQKEENIDRIKEMLPKKYEELENLDGEIKNFENKLGEIGKNELKLAAWKTYKLFEDNAVSAGKRAEEIKEKYHGNPLPSGDECLAAEKTLSEYKALLSGKTVSLGEEEKARLDFLSSEFLDGVPTAEKMDEMQEKITSASLLSAELKEKKTKITEIPETALSEISSAKKEYETAKKEYENTAEYLSTGKKLSKTKFIIAAIISLVILLSGVFSFFFSTPVGVGLSVVGGVGILLTGFLYLSKKTDVSGGETKNPEKELKKKQAEDAEIKIRKILAAYGKNAERGIEYSVDTFISEIEENSKNKASVSEMAETLSIAAKETVGFFEKYGITDMKPAAAMAKLRSDISEYESLLKIKEGNERRDSTLNSEIADKKAFLSDFCVKYGLDFENIDKNLSDLRTDSIEFENCIKTETEQKKRAEEYKVSENVSDEQPIFSEEEKKDIEEKLSELRDIKAKTERNISEAETLLEENDGILSEKERETEKLKKYQRSLSVISSAAEMLKTADSTLKNRYISPVRDNFVEYSEILREVIGEKIMISEDFDISFEKDGMMRSEKYLSSGEKSLCAFCFRMALTDNMYEAEKPFIVLDDPFVFLDAEHFERVKKLLSELSEYFQIIYFTCHESRAL